MLLCPYFDSGRSRSSCQSNIWVQPDQYYVWPMQWTASTILILQSYQSVTCARIQKARFITQTPHQIGQLHHNLGRWIYSSTSKINVAFSNDNFSFINELFSTCTICSKIRCLYEISHLYAVASLIAITRTRSGSHPSPVKITKINMWTFTNYKGDHMFENSIFVEQLRCATKVALVQSLSTTCYSGHIWHTFCAPSLHSVDTRR